MASKKGGYPAKGTVIANNFNIKKKGRLSKANLEKFEAKLCSVCHERPIHARGMCAACYAKKWGEKEKKEKNDLLDDDRSANRMLQDMRWVYRKLRGRNKLKKLIKGDDRQFVFMVKELMKIESALLTAKIRKEGSEGITGQQGFFVVLKGLEDEKTALSDKTVNIEQIQRAIDPDLDEIYEAEEKSYGDAPEQLRKSEDR